MAETPSQPFPKPKGKPGIPAEALAKDPAIPSRSVVAAPAPAPAESAEMAEMRAMMLNMMKMVSATVQAPPTPPQPDVLPDAAQASLVKKVLNSNRSNAARFLLIIVPDDDHPRCEEYPTIDGLIDKLRELMGAPCHVFPILGTQLTITGDTYKQLGTPFGSIALFDIPTTVTQEAGHRAWLGTRPAIVEVVEEEETEEEAEDEPEE